MRIGRALRDRPLKYDLIAWPVVGMGDVEQVEPQKLLARAADDLAEAVVDRSEDAIQIDLAETGHGMRDERRKLLLVIPHGKFARSEEHKSEIQSIKRSTYADFC